METVPAVRSWSTPARLALLAGLLGVTYRLAMLLAEVPPTNSDEATSGLVALHIVQGREFPLFFYGQYYMGALESYLAAPFFAVAGSSVLALRLPNLLLYAAFLLLMWRLTRRLYGPWWATCTVVLLVPASDRILKNQLISGGGYPEMNPAGALLVLLAVNLGLGVVRHRAAGYALWGLIAGLTLWDDWLILPFVVAAGLVLLIAAGRELRGRTGGALGAGLAVGLIPIVAHNLTAAPEHRSLAVYANLAGGSAAGWPDRLHGGVLFGLPMGLGFCSPSRCEPWQLWWGGAVPLLLVAAIVLAARGLRRSVDRVGRIRQGGRLALLGAAAATLVAYAVSDAAANTPVESARYLSTLLIALPALLWPLWAAATAAGRGRRVLVGAARVGLVAVAAGLVAASGAVLTRAAELAAPEARRRALIAELDRLGVDRIYSEYWTCNNVIFLTRERIVCAVLADDLTPGWDRYPPYRALVRTASQPPAYVLPAGTAQADAVADRLARTGVPVRTHRVAGYDIHRPAAPVDLTTR